MVDRVVDPEMEYPAAISLLGHGTSFWSFYYIFALFVSYHPVLSSYHPYPIIIFILSSYLSCNPIYPVILYILSSYLSIYPIILFNLFIYLSINPITYPIYPIYLFNLFNLFNLFIILSSYNPILSSYPIILSHHTIPSSHHPIILYSNKW